MPNEPTQAERLAQVKSPLGDDVLLLRRMAFTEALSEPYVLTFDLLSEDDGIAYKDLLGEVLTLEVELASGDKRFYTGHVTEFGMTGTEGRYTVYQAVCRPWIWFLTRTADCRIFQEKKAPDVIKDVFRDLGFSDFEDKLSGTYRQLEYCVQYRETDFDFVSRLMEDEGIYYYVKHEDGKNVLVLSDDYASHSPVIAESEIPFLPPGDDAGLSHGTVHRILVRQAVKSGNYVVNSFDFEKPGADLKGASANPKSHTQADHEVYDYEADYIEASDGAQYAKVRLQERQAAHERVTGAASARNLAAGGLFELSDHPRGDMNREYLVVLTKQSMSADLYESGGEQDYRYDCSFVAMDSKTPFRPQQKTHRALVRGPQTATVVGKKGEEIWTDKYGRVKVQFHWDRYGKKDENSSCWLRVAQVWSGGTFGGIHIPRIGEEVIVDFLEGDPDRPIVTGRVYNAKNMPPYGLPDNQTQMGIKTRSSPKGSADNFNELRFEDKKDAEEIYFHAEKDFNRVVENDDTLKVGFEKKDKGDRTVEIHNDETRKVGNDQTEEIGFGQMNAGDQTVKVYNDRSVTIGNNDTLTVERGDHKIDVQVGKTEHEALTSIELKVGASSIKIEPAQITIKSPQINIQADATLDASSPMTTVNGDATLTLKGGITLIN